MQLSGSMIVSGSLTVAGNIFGSVATASLAFTASSADSFLVRSSLTSSLLFVTGSSRLGNIITDTHNVTGSLNVSGSVNVFNNEFIVQPTGVKLGNIITDAHTITGSFSVSGSINIDGGTY
jgi:cytoskeletal protein CcmA (bactofilin family)